MPRVKNSDRSRGLARGEAIERHDLTHREWTVEEFAERWFTEYVLPNNKYSEHKSKQSILSHHLIPCFGKMPLGDVATHHIERFKSAQLSKGFNSKTINNQLTVLSSCLNTAHAWGIRQAASPKVRWLRCAPPRTDFLLRDECHRLLNRAQGIWRELILTALRTGMRRGELKALRWEDINWDTGVLSVRHSWCEVRNGLVTPKSNRERHIPLDTDVSAVLYPRRGAAGFVFTNGKGNVLDTKSMSEALRRCCTEAGLRAVGWHVLRHTFASHLAMANAPLTAIQALLGHVSITTTMRYAHLAPSTLRTTVDLLNPAKIPPDFGQPVGNGGYAVGALGGSHKSYSPNEPLAEKVFEEEEQGRKYCM